MGDLRECFEKMSQFLGEIDEGCSQYEEDEMCEEMIGPEDIDEDGNIISK